MKSLLAALVFIFVVACNDGNPTTIVPASLSATSASEQATDVATEVQDTDGQKADEVGGFALTSGSGSAERCYTCSRGAYREKVCSKEAANDLISRGWRCSLN